MSNKLLVLSLVAFFTVFALLTMGFDYTIGDVPYYAASGKLGEGHDLTLIVLRPIYLLLPSCIENNVVHIFINFMFAWSVYFLVKPFVKRPEWAFILAPIAPLAGVYAQLFAISLFNFMMGFYFRSKEKIAKNIKKHYSAILPPLFLILVFLAHYWTGLFVSFIFVVYLMAFDRSRGSMKQLLLPAIAIGAFFFFFSVHGMGGLAFLIQPSEAVPPGSMTAAHFFVLLSRGLSFFFLSFAGLGLLYKKYRNFFKLNLMLFLIPLSIFVLPTAIYWNWRLFYFMPFLLLMTVLLSYLFEGKTKR